MKCRETKLSQLKRMTLKAFKRMAKQGTKQSMMLHYTLVIKLEALEDV